MEQLYRVNIEIKSRQFENIKIERERDEKSYEKLYQKMLEENEKLFLSNQNDLTNTSSYAKSKICLKEYGISQESIGFIEIPVMDIRLPIYLGANEENMKKGAVHLTETSYPIEGKHTNCVIAAHRGYSKAPMFRDIELLKEGDVIFIDNLWGRLTYKVIRCAVIRPTETKWLKIQEGKELLTLLTCHPYRENYQRYLVLCERQT